MGGQKPPKNPEFSRFFAKFRDFREFREISGNFRKFGHFWGFSPKFAKIAIFGPSVANGHFSPITRLLAVRNSILGDTCVPTKKIFNFYTELRCLKNSDNECCALTPLIRALTKNERSDEDCVLSKSRLGVGRPSPFFCADARRRKNCELTLDAAR